MEELITLLTAALKPVKVYRGRRKKGETGQQYVICQLVSTKRSGYASDLARWRQKYVDIRLYQAGGRVDEEKVMLIIQTLENSGWKLYDGPQDLEFADDTNTAGVTMEFIHEEAT